MYENLNLKPLLTPTPANSGKSKTELGQQHLQILAACDSLLTALKAAAPSDSAFDHVPDDSGAAARDAWRGRTELVQGLRSEFQLETMKIAIGWPTS